MTDSPRCSTTKLLEKPHLQPRTRTPVLAPQNGTPSACTLPAAWPPRSFLGAPCRAHGQIKSAPRATHATDLLSPRW